MTTETPRDLTRSAPGASAFPDAAADRPGTPVRHTRRSALRVAGGAAAGAALVVHGLRSPADALAAVDDAATVRSARAARRDTGGAAPGLPSSASVLAQNRRLVDYEILELAALLRSGDTTSVALTQAYLSRIRDFNGPFETYATTPGYNAFVRIDADSALEQAAKADARLKAEGAGAPFLCGIPIGAKDSIGVEGFAAQNGTTAYAGNLCTEDGTAMARLRAQGVVFLGITICSSFSGSITGSFAGNAWNRQYFPGGSSQGSGVAPVARLAAACIGEETGGSIIFPSAANGASGIKPSLGLCSVAGVMPLSPAIDVIGPISRSMRDSALLLNAMYGPDAEHDPQTLTQPMPYAPLPIVPRPAARPLEGVVIGIPQADFMSSQTSATSQAASPQSTYAADNKAAFDRFRAELTAMGATVKEFPGLDLRNADNNPYFGNTTVLGTSDGSNVTPPSAVVASNRSDIRYIEAIAEFSATRPPNQQALLLQNYGRTAAGDQAPSLEGAAKYNAGITSDVRREGDRRRRQLAANYHAALEEHDVDFMLVMNFATKIGLRSDVSPGVTFRTYYQVPNALAWPMVSIPIGYGSDADGLPICAQFWAPRFQEAEIVQAAIDYQALHPEWHTAAPADPPTPIPQIPPVGPLPLPPALDPLLSNDPLVFLDALPDVFRP